MLTVIVSDTPQYYTGRADRPAAAGADDQSREDDRGAIGGFVFGTVVFAAVGAWWLPVVPPIARILLGLGIVAARDRGRSV